MDARGITNQSDFARLNEWIPAKVGRWRRGSLPDSQKDLERLARVLHVPWQWLLVGDDCAEDLIAYREGRWRPPPIASPDRARVARHR